MSPIEMAEHVGGFDKPDKSKSALKEQVAGSHYKNLPIQPVEYCQKNKLGFCESSVVKYVTRHREKNGRQDIEKAIHFLQLLLELEYPLFIIDTTKLDNKTT